MVVAIELMKKWPDSGYILKAETTEFADRLGMICKRKRTIKDKSKNFGVFGYTFGEPKYENNAILLQMYKYILYICIFLQILRLWSS